MTTAEITVNDRIIFNGIHQVGFVKSIKPSGHEAAATTNPKYKTAFYTTMDKAFPDCRHVFNGPAYVTSKNGDHTVNPELIAFIDGII